MKKLCIEIKCENYRKEVEFVTCDSSGIVTTYGEYCELGVNFDSKNGSLDKCPYKLEHIVMS